MTGINMTTIRATVITAISAFVLAACGGGDSSSGDTTPIQEVTISAKPAFLSRSCTNGQSSPQLFCPHANGG